MPINYEAAKTLIKGLVQKMKSFRGNWEQNDPTADDYIKNRPFYTEIKESKVYILPKNSYKFEVGEYAAVCQGNIYQDVIDDKIYTIEIDNNSFELKCKTLDADPVDLKYFGSLSVFVMATNNCDRATASTMVLEQMGIEDTDDNFCIVTASIPDINEKICMIGVEDVISETHSVAMYSIEDIEKVHKIDNKYLPDMNYLSYNRNQNLTYKQQKAALSNIGDAFYDGVTQIANGHYVNYSAQQWLNDSEKEFARNNIDAISENDVYSDGRTYEYKWNGYVHHYDFLTLKGNSYGKIIDYLPCTVDYGILDCKVVMSDGTIYTNWRIGTNCYVLGGDSLGAIIVKSPGEILTHIIGNTRYGSTAKTIGIYGYSNNGVYVSELSVTFKIPKTGIRVNDVNGTEKIITVETDGCISDSCIPETVARKTDILSSDWNQNDETAADYVKNRPFYTGDPVETTLIPEQTVAFADQGGGFGMANSPVNVDLVEGNTYIVIFDGETYECTCQLFEGGSTIIGSPKVFGVEDTGEPFFYMSLNGVAYAWYAYDTETEHTLSLSIIERPVVQIPEKYLPIAGDDTYGVVKKNDIITRYYFNSYAAPKEEMHQAIDAFRQGKASICWRGQNVIDASREEIDGINNIYITFGNEPTHPLRYIDTGRETYYSITLGSIVPQEISAESVYFYDNENGGYTSLRCHANASDSADRYLESYDDAIFNGVRIGNNAIELKSPSNKRFKITVDDNGTLTVTEVV